MTTNLEDHVQDIQRDFETALEDVQNDMGQEAAEQGAFDLSVSIALMHSDDPAREFLRRHWGCVPETYEEIKKIQARYERERVRQEREGLIRPEKRVEIALRLAERKAERIKDR